MKDRKPITPIGPSHIAVAMKDLRGMLRIIEAFRQLSSELHAKYYNMVQQDLLTPKLEGQGNGISPQDGPSHNVPGRTSQSVPCCVSAQGTPLRSSANDQKSVGADDPDRGGNAADAKGANRKSPGASTSKG